MRSIMRWWGYNKIKYERLNGVLRKKKKRNKDELLD